MANTPNFALYKPNRADTSVEVDTSLSDNFTKIDTELQNNKGGLAAHISNPNAHTSENISHADGSVKTILDNHEERLGTVDTLEARVDEIETLGLDVLAPNLEGRISTIESDVEGILAPATFEAMNQQSYTFDEYRIGYVNDKAMLKGDLVLNVKDYEAVGDGVADDQNAIVNAVADAKTKGMTIYWGPGTYLSTNNIPDFHSVKHTGEGVIQRGTDLFYISPKGTQRNKIYAATSGASNTFDGLSASQPVAKVQTAFDWLANYGPILTGFWEVVLTAGTFVNRAVLQQGLRSENPIEITGFNVGVYPAIPTTIISEGVGASAVGIFASNGSKIKVTNVKFTEFNGTTSSAGIKVANGSEVTTSNCHFTNCYWGVSGEGRCKTTIPDGVFDNCGTLNGGGGTGAGIRSLQLNNHAIGIQNNGNQTNTALFKNCYQAILAQESSTGHMDWCTVQDCGSGIVARVNARVNADGTSFKRNTADFRVDANGHVFITSNTVFGTGADESTNKVVTSGGGNVTNNTIISGKELAYSTTEKAIDMQYLNQTVATTSNTVVYTATLKAPLWRGTPTTITPMKKIYFRIFGTINGTTSNKRVNVRLGTALTAVTYAASDNGTFVADGYIYFTGADTQYLFLKSYRHLGTSPKQSRVNGTNVMTSDVNLTIEAQVDNVADNVVVEMIEVGWA